MTSGRIALAVVCLGAVALSAAQLWSLWRTGQPIFRRQRGRARVGGGSRTECCFSLALSRGYSEHHFVSASYQS